MSAVSITRHYVTLPDRQVHYLRAGSGPAVVLLHQSPQSADSLMPMIEALAARHLVIALDTPGFGNSDLLPKGSPVSIDGLAAAAKQALDALGLRKFGLFGQHTGAAIAMSYAVQFPEDLTCVVHDGYPAFTAQESAHILSGYFDGSLEPRWDGGHLNWLWWRCRDQTVFFPWFDQREEARMAMNVPTPEIVHQAMVIDFLRAGDDYKLGYQAAFEFDGIPPIARLKVPTFVLAREDDPLGAHISRLPENPALNCELLPAGARQELIDRACVLLGEHPGQVDGVSMAPQQSAGLQRGYVAVSNGQIHYRAIIPDSATRPPLFICPQAAGSSAYYAEMSAALAQNRAVYALDAPGHGDSAFPELGKLESGQMISSLKSAIETLADQPVDLLGDGTGNLMVLELCKMMGDGVRKSVLLDLPDPQTLAAERITETIPQWDGTHLLSLWHELRDRQLFAPWQEKTLAAQRPAGPDLSPERLQIQLLDALKCGRYYGDARRIAANYAWADRLEAHTHPALRGSVADIDSINAFLTS